ncbi:MAG: hypothetical protein AB2598_13205 [Candidatus Thiodiazotropha sp.]
MWIINALQVVLGLMAYPLNWSRMAAGETPSRFAVRNITGSFLGPSPRAGRTRREDGAGCG